MSKQKPTPSLGEIRQAIADAETDLQTLNTSLLPIDDAVKRAMAQWDRAIENSTTFEHRVCASLWHGDRDNFLSDVLDGAAVALLPRELVEAGMRRIIEARAAKHQSDSLVLTVKELATRLKAAKERLEALQVEEECEILRLEGVDGYVPRRAEADPRLIMLAWTRNTELLA